MQTKLSKRALIFLKRLPPKHERQVVARIVLLAENPFATDSKKISGSPYLRVDSGEYRVIYQLVGDVLSVVLVGKRNDDEIYRRLRRMLG